MKLTDHKYIYQDDELQLLLEFDNGVTAKLTELAAFVDEDDQCDFERVCEHVLQALGVASTQPQYPHPDEWYAEFDSADGDWVVQYADGVVRCGFTSQEEALAFITKAKGITT